MANEKVVYLIVAFQIEIDKFEKSRYKSQSYTAYYSNLKLVHGLLSGKNLKSYSTLSRHIVKSGHYITNDLYLKVNTKKIFCCKIIIRKLSLNSFYSVGKEKEYFDIERLIIREIGLKNLMLGLEGERLL